MDLREKFKKEKGFGVMAIRQDYAGQRPYEDGFCDDYVEWLESKVKNQSISISQQRELLIDFCEAYVQWKFEYPEDPDDTESIVDWYMEVKDN